MPSHHDPVRSRTGIRRVRKRLCDNPRGDGLARPLPLESSQQGQTVSIVITATAFDENASVQAGYGSVGAAYAPWAASVEEAFRNSGLFATVSVGLQPADQHIRVHIVRRQAINQTALVLSSATAAVIPLTWSVRYTVELSLERHDGTAATFKSSEEQRVWMHLLLAPALPFAAPRHASAGAVFDLTLDALAQAQRTGAI